jgi:hypothetical protein
VTLLELIADLGARGVSLTARLVVDAPAGAMTPEILAALTDHKPRLLHRLARELEWAQLSTQWWGPQTEDPAPDIDVIVPNRERQRIALETIQGQPGDADESDL